MYTYSISISAIYRQAMLTGSVRIWSKPTFQESLWIRILWYGRTFCMLSSNFVLNTLSYPYALINTVKYCRESKTHFPLVIRTDLISLPNLQFNAMSALSLWWQSLFYMYCIGGISLKHRLKQYIFSCNNSPTASNSDLESFIQFRVTPSTKKKYILSWY